ncbi:MAG: hypothetical protein ACRC0F_10155, partial [Cetobacterium sp.]
MGRIVTVNVVDLTRPIEQKGFKKVALVDLEATANAATIKITDTKGLEAGSALERQASAFFANGGQDLIVGQCKIVTPSDISAALTGIHETNEFYGLNVICSKANQATYLEAVKTWVEGNKKLAIVEINGSVPEITAVSEFINNSDRVVAYANSMDAQGGQASAISGVCFPQDEGSITWGNKVVTGVDKSKFKLSEEDTILELNVNYVTEEKGLIISQYGRTTSGSNADITRSKDWLENRCAEALTSTLI